MTKANIFQNHGFVVMLILFILICFIAFTQFDNVNIMYQMPNGIVCKDKYFPQSITFYNCEDGKEYVDPEWFKEIKVK